MTYQPTHESVSQHPVPEWYHDAKFGIFIHWGLYSVPAYAPVGRELGEILENGGWAEWFANNAYAEWYMNTLRIEGSPTHQYHVEKYGADFDYFDFVPLFNEAVQAWQPDEWADLFAQAGAQYAVLTTKHHDGFLMWPSETPNPHREGYCCDRDLAGELGDAVRAKGLRMAYYYSGGVDWTFNPQVVQDIADLPKAVPQMQAYIDYANAHWRELIDRYDTAILWNDIAYPADADLPELFAYYYNQMPDGVVNNRFTQKFELREGHIAADQHHDFETPEYVSFSEIREKKWESCRGIGASFGYNQVEGLEHYQTSEDLIHSLIDIVSKNGNLLLNVGPTADGTIPEIQCERLLDIGKWLTVNGEAIYKTRPWRVAEGSTDAGIDLRFTQTDDALYATLMGTHVGNTLVLNELQASENTTITLLGRDERLSWQQAEAGIEIVLDESLPESVAHSIKISPKPA